MPNVRVRRATLVAGVAPLALLSAACRADTQAHPRPHSSSGATAVTSAPSPTTTIEQAPGTSTTAGGAQVQLAVDACPTTFALARPPTLAPLPTSASVHLADGRAGGVAVYSDTAGNMTVVGPAGWQCTASYGADGSGGVVVYPPGESVLESPGEMWHVSGGSTVEAVLGSETSACQGCAVGQACPLFAAAARDYQSDFGRPCPVARSPHEQTFMTGTGVVGFEDPPGVAGDGAPSGGRYPANGVMTYYPESADGSWVETCTLPVPEHGLCTDALDAFVSAYGSR